jgi:hypothetical protein
MKRLLLESLHGAEPSIVQRFKRHGGTDTKCSVIPCGYLMDPACPRGQGTGSRSWEIPRLAVAHLSVISIRMIPI